MALAFFALAARPEVVIQEAVRAERVGAGPREGLRGAAPPPGLERPAVAKALAVIRGVRINVLITPPGAVTPRPRPVTRPVVCPPLSSAAEIIVRGVAPLTPGPAPLTRVVGPARATPVSIPPVVQAPDHSGVPPDPNDHGRGLKEDAVHVALARLGVAGAFEARDIHPRPRVIAPPPRALRAVGARKAKPVGPSAGPSPRDLAERPPDRATIKVGPLAAGSRIRVDRRRGGPIGKGKAKGHRVKARPSPAGPEDHLRGVLPVEVIRLPRVEVTAAAPKTGPVSVPLLEAHAPPVKADTVPDMLDEGGVE